MPTISPYPLDTSGNNPANFIADEVHALTPEPSSNYANYIIPNYAPFFEDSLSVFKMVGGVRVPLVLGQDYHPIFPVAEAQAALGIRLCGGVLIYDRVHAGDYSLDYQTIGGEFSANDTNGLLAAYQRLYEVVYLTWDIIVDKPLRFTPDYHLHEESDQTMQVVNDKLEQIRAILASRSGISQTRTTTTLTVSQNRFDLDLSELFYSAKGRAPNALDDVLVVIGNGVMVCSTTTNTPAVRTGIWPSGSTLEMVVNGSVLGRGGNAAANIGSLSTPSLPGNGGDAIYLSTPLKVTLNAMGKVSGGGGGGGWSKAQTNDQSMNPGSPSGDTYHISVGGGGGYPFGKGGYFYSSSSPGNYADGHDAPTGVVTSTSNLTPYSIPIGGSTESSGLTPVQWRVLRGGNGGYFNTPAQPGFSIDTYPQFTYEYGPAGNNGKAFTGNTQLLTLVNNGGFVGNY